MKKAHSIKLISLAAIVLLFAACSKSFVDIDPQGVFAADTYYKDQQQAFTGLVATYDIMRKNSGGFENMITFMNAGSDDNYAGGGGESDGVGIQSFSNHTVNAETMPGSYWGDHYQGIFRANTLLQKLPNTQMDENLKARFVGEAKALRAIYYFNLVRMFKNIPLILEPVETSDIYNIKQTSSDSIYNQIEKDLTEAIPALPATVPLPTEGGRITKVAAEAMLGKVYIYDNKPQLAVPLLADVNGSTPGQPNAYGNSLLTNFKDLWVFTNKFNSESILEVTHSNQVFLGDWSLWGSSSDESNTVDQMVGPRSYTRLSPDAPDIYPAGWSFNVFTQDFYDAIKNDPRFSATVFDAKALEDAGLITYVYGYQNTGYFLNKFIPMPSDKATVGSAELNFQGDSYVIRLADTYLLEAEALGASGPRAQALLDAVRARVGLPSVPVSMNAIKNERRFELAGEGHRFFDLVRWGDAATKLANRGFTAGKSEILPIPASELKGTLLVQNPGYE